MTDEEHAREIRQALGDLNVAIRAARQSGLYVKVDLANVSEVGRAGPWDPARAINISRPIK